MSTVDLINQRITLLPESIQKEVLNFIEFLFTKNQDAINQHIDQRTAGLHATGDLKIAEDFDAPLPDDFWVGKHE
jgi:hypothetical protein